MVPIVSQHHFSLRGHRQASPKQTGPGTETKPPAPTPDTGKAQESFRGYPEQRESVPDHREELNRELEKSPVAPVLQTGSCLKGRQGLQYPLGQHPHLRARKWAQGGKVTFLEFPAGVPETWGWNPGVPAPGPVLFPLLCYRVLACLTGTRGPGFTDETVHLLDWNWVLLWPSQPVSRCFLHGPKGIWAVG